MPAKFSLPQTAQVRHRTPSLALPLAILAAALFLTLVPGAIAQATQYYWKGDATSGSWDTSNWWNGTNNTALNVGYGQLNFDNNSWTTMTNNSSYTQWRIYFASAATEARTVTGSGTMTLYDYSSQVPVIRNDSSATMTLNNNYSVGIKNAGSQDGNRIEVIAANGNLSLGGTLSTANDGNVAREFRFDAASGRTITVGGTITEANSSNALQIRKVSDGTLILTGNNSYTGSTLIDAGVVVIGHSSALGGTGNGTTVTSGGALQLSNNITVSGEALTLAGSGISSGGALRSISGSNAYTGLITANGGTTTVGAASGATLLIGAVNSGGSEFWVVGDGTTIVSGGATNSGSGTAFVKTNAGTAMLTASNAWSGNEYIREGTVVISNNNAFGTGGTTYLGADTNASTATATLTLGSGVINSNAIFVEAGGTGVRTLGYQTASGIGAQLGALTLNTNSLAFNVATGGTLLFGGGLNFNGTVNNRLALDGGGTLIVTNAGTGIANSDYYQVRIGNGTMIIGAGTIIGRTNVSSPGAGHAIDLGMTLDGTIANAASALYASNGVTVSNSIYVSTTNFQSRTLGVVGAGTATYSGVIGLNNANLTVNATNASDNVNITGAITNFTGSTAGNNGLIKTGAGTLALSANSTYGGTTWVNAGVLRAVTNATAMGTNTLVLNGGNLELILGGSPLTWSNNLIFSNNAQITMDGLTSGNATRNSTFGTLRMAGPYTLSAVKGTNFVGGNIRLILDAVTLDASGVTFANGDSTYLIFNNGLTGTDTSFTITNNTSAVYFSNNAISIGSGVLTKQGSAGLYLAASNDTGGIKLEGGALFLANEYGFTKGTLTIAPTTGSKAWLETTSTLVSSNAQNNNMAWNGDFSFGSNSSTTVNLHLGTGAVTLGAHVTNEVRKLALIVGGEIGDGGSGYSLTKTGAGTLVLAGSNTYSGGTTISVGTLLLSNNNALGAAGLTLGSLGTSLNTTLALGNGIVNTNGIYVEAANNQTYLRTLSVMGDGNSATQLGTITFANTNRTTYFNFSPTNNTTLTFGGGFNLLSTAYATRVVVDGGGTLIITNNGSVTTNGTAALQFRITNGTVIIGEGAIGARTDFGNRGIDLGAEANGNASGAAVSLYASNGVTVNESIYVQTTNAATRVMGIAGAGTATFANGIALSSNSILSVSAGSGATAVFDGNITNFSTSTINTNGLVKIGVGTVILAGTNDYAGSTTISEGTLQIGNGTDKGSIATTSAITNNGALVYDVGSGNRTLSAPVSGSGSLTQAGTGTLTLSGASANSYSGPTTVSAGVLELNKTDAEAIVGSVTVNTGATLLVSASGQVSDTSAITLSGGTITRASGVSERFGSLDLTDASFLDFGSGTGGQLRFGTYEGGTTPSALLTVDSFFPGNSLVFGSDISAFIPASSSGPYSGTYFSFDQGFTTSWNGSDTFTITAIPETSTVVAAIGLAGMMLWPARRRLLRDAKSILGIRRPARDRMQQYRHS